MSSLDPSWWLFAMSFCVLLGTVGLTVASSIVHGDDEALGAPIPIRVEADDLSGTGLQR